LKGRERWKWEGEKMMVENGLCSSLTNREVPIHAWKHLWKYASPNTSWRHLFIYMNEDIHMLHKWSARDAKPHKC
jgi:hypothetical protein